MSDETKQIERAIESEPVARCRRCDNHATLIAAMLGYDVMQARILDAVAMVKAHLAGEPPVPSAVKPWDTPPAVDAVARSAGDRQNGPRAPADLLALLDAVEASALDRHGSQSGVWGQGYLEALKDVRTALGKEPETP